MEQVLKAFKDQDVYEQVGSLIVDACMQPPVRKQATPADEGSSDKGMLLDV
jgi:hypothetical protein